MIRAKFLAVLFAAAFLFIMAPASPAQAACASPAGVAGDLYYNTSVNVLQYCNGTSWIATGKGPGTGGGCASPAGAAGQIFYNTTSSVSQYCNGNEWVAMGPIGGSNQNRWAQIDAGSSHTCAVKTNGTLYCWGYDSSGQLGNGATTDNQVSPVQESTAATNWASVSAGVDHTCAVKTTGTLYCWGADTSGQLGNGATTGDQISPVQESTAATNWASVSAGQYYTCAVKTTGTLYCWGSDSNGQLGNGAGGSAVSPVQESTAATNWASVSAGVDHTCAVKTDGTLYCWGLDIFGQLGNGAGGNAVSPVQESTAATNWAAVSVNYRHTCAVKTDGTLWCWGNDMYGQLGNGAATADQVSPVQESTAATNWASVSAGNYHTCAVKTNGTLYCWGYDTNGQLGNGATTGNQVSPVQESTAATNWASVSAGNGHTCAVKTNGTLYCWGLDTYGQLGNGAVGNQISPVQESTTASNWASVSAGGTHTCAVKTTGTLYCWGADTNGQLGNGAAGSQVSPMQESTAASNWASVSAGFSYACAVKTTGTLYCWGYDANDQLGNGAATADQISPVQESTAATNWALVSAGSSHTCAVKTNGTLYCWGADFNGRLGNGAGGSAVSPVQESTAATNWASVSAGANHTCAVKTNGTLYCWGSDSWGQIGNGATTGDQISPVQESTAASDWAVVSAGNNFTCAVKTTGTLWCWGYDGLGQLGNGAAGAQVSPMQESTAASDWTTVSTGGGHSCAVKTNGILYCWGDDQYGQLGNGTTTGNQISPVAIGPAWSKIGVGNYHSCAIGVSPASLFCWGENKYGQLGAGIATGESPILNEVCATLNGVDYPSGSFFYNTTYSVLEFCNGIGWVKTGR